MKILHNSNIDCCILYGIRHTLYANDVERIWWNMVGCKFTRNSF